MSRKWHGLFTRGKIAQANWISMILPCGVDQPFSSLVRIFLRQLSNRIDGNSPRSSSTFFPFYKQCIFVNVSVLRLSLRVIDGNPRIERFLDQRRAICLQKLVYWDIPFINYPLSIFFSFQSFWPWCSCCHHKEWSTLQNNIQATVWFTEWDVTLE